MLATSTIIKFELHILPGIVVVHVPLKPLPFPEPSVVNLIYILFPVVVNLVTGGVVHPVTTKGDVAEPPFLIVTVSLQGFAVSKSRSIKFRVINLPAKTSIIQMQFKLDRYGFG